MNTMKHGVYIEADDVRRSPFRVALTPLPSLNGALRDAVGAGRNGTPAAWCDAVRGHLRTQDYETLAPFSVSAQTLVPDPLLGLTAPPGESLKDGIERMMATPIEFLAQEISACRAASGNAAWREAERDPLRWLRRYVASLLRAWKGFAPVWQQARPVLDREVQRVGMATALDAQLELLDGLLDDAAVRDGHWRIRCSFDQGRVRFPHSGLVLLPLVAGRRTSIFATMNDIIGSVSYPVPGVLALEPAEPPRAALEALLGVPRSRVLRALGAPTTIGRLAQALRAVPSAATHHVGALEAAGLVERDRRGRNVLVRRTARGEALLALYDDAAKSSRAVGSVERHSPPSAPRPMYARREATAEDADGPSPPTFGQASSGGSAHRLGA
jgi:DNA-binding transcriptional ArsR family regulator